MGSLDFLDTSFTPLKMLSTYKEKYINYVFRKHLLIGFYSNFLNLT